MNAGPILELHGLAKRFGGLSVVENLSFVVASRLAHCDDRTERRRQNHGVQPDIGPVVGRGRPHFVRWPRYLRRAVATTRSATALRAVSKTSA